MDGTCAVPGWYTGGMLAVGSRAAAVNLVAAVAYVVAVLAVAFWPQHVDENVALVDWRVTREVADLLGVTAPDVYRAVEWCANVALFVPLGWFATTLLRLPWAATVAVGAAGSAVVETCQGVLLDGRTASAADVAANTLGAAVGATVGVLARRT